MGNCTSQLAMTLLLLIILIYKSFSIVTIKFLIGTPQYYRSHVDLYFFWYYQEVIAVATVQVLLAVFCCVHEVPICPLYWELHGYL